MSRLLQPWTIHDADIALWPAWKDGLPMRGPGDEGAGRRRPEPVLHCKAELNIQETWEKSVAPGMDWRGNSEGRMKSYAITATFPDGAVVDDYGRVVSRLAGGGMYVLVVRFAAGAEWAVMRFFYVTVEADGAAESGQVLMRPMKMAAGWMQEDTGSGAFPDLEPVIYGEVEWVCGADCIPCLRYDPEAETWSDRDENDTGDGSRHVEISPVSGTEGADVAVSYYVPVLSETVPVDGALRRMDLEWVSKLAFTVGRYDSAGWHGLAFSNGYLLQEGNFVEPLEMIPQSRELDEPVVVFRYLARVYAVLGHGVLAVPGLLSAAHDATHDYAFRIVPTGDMNPATGESGLTLLPGGAWLDGTVEP